MTRKGQLLPDGTADLFERELSQALKGRVQRAADIVTPPRARRAPAGAERLVVRADRAVPRA